MNINNEIRNLETKLAELKNKKKKIDDLKNIVVSDFNLPFELESVVGHLVNNTKKDYVVYVRCFDDDWFLGLDDFDTESKIIFVSNDENFIGDVCEFRLSGEIHSANWEPQIEIPIYMDVKDKENILWFCCIFKYTPKGYYIERLPVNMETGEVVWPSDF